MVRHRSLAIAFGIAAVLVWFSTNPIFAHHSLVNFDTSAPMWIEGTVVRLDVVNPHSKMYVEQELEGGEIQHWIVDSPVPRILNRRKAEGRLVDVGDVIEVCGFEALRSQEEFRSASADPAIPNPERFLNGTMVVMPDGESQFWSDYGHLSQCLDPNDPSPLIR